MDRSFYHEFFQQLTLARGGGVDLAVDQIQQFASGRIPDLSHAREALDAWGIPYEEGGEPILQMFSSMKTLKVVLPPGWTFTQRTLRGGGGHTELLDERGASRIQWHVHGWDPVSLSVNRRFTIPPYFDISATKAVVRIYDGPTVIHTIPYQYPHARIRFKPDGEPSFYKSGYPGQDAKWTHEMRDENYRVQDEAYNAASTWLDTNRPGWNHSIKSWML